MKKKDTKSLMSKFDDSSKGRDRIAKALVVILGFVIISGCVSAVQDIKQSKQIELKNKVLEKERIEKEELEKVKAKEKEKKKTLASQSIHGWIEYNKPNTDISYNKESKILSGDLRFKSNIGISNGISMANQDAFDIVKILEKEFPNEVNQYTFAYNHKMVDKYGNEDSKPVYSFNLDREELDKVNWEGIDSNMLVDLATNVYKHTELIK